MLRVLFVNLFLLLLLLTLVCFVYDELACIFVLGLFHILIFFSLLSVIIFLVSAIHLGTQRKQNQIKMTR